MERVFGGVNCSKMDTFCMACELTEVCLLQIHPLGYLLLIVISDRPRLFESVWLNGDESN